MAPNPQNAGTPAATDTQTTAAPDSNQRGGVAQQPRRPEREFDSHPGIPTPIDSRAENLPSHGITIWVLSDIINGNPGRVCASVGTTCIRITWFLNHVAQHEKSGDQSADEFESEEIGVVWAKAFFRDGSSQHSNKVWLRG